MAGSWLIAAFRLAMVQQYFALDEDITLTFYLELFFLAMAIFGLLTAVSVVSELKARIKRLDALGEKDW